MSWWVEEPVPDTIDVVETYPNIPYEPWDVWSEEDLWKQSEDPWKQSLW